MKKKPKSLKNMGVMIFGKFIAFVIPLVVYLLMILLVFPAPNSGFIALGVLGSIIMGLGLVNIVSLVDDMYLGHIITAILLASGALFVIVSSIVMYTPTIYSGLNENHVTFYFVVWLLLMISGIYYLFFRHAISLDLQRNGISKSNIKKKMEGMRNYWWYECLKDQFSYLWIFRANKLFTTIFPCFCLIYLLLGWWSAIFLLVLFALIVLLMLNFAMCFLILATWNHTRTNRVDRSSLIILGAFIFPIAATFGLIIYFIRYM